MEGFKRRKEELDHPDYYFTTEKAQYFSELFKDLPYENKQSWELQMKYKARMESLLAKPDKDYLLDMNARAMAKARDPKQVAKKMVPHWLQFQNVMIEDAR